MLSGHARTFLLLRKAGTQQSVLFTDGYQGPGGGESQCVSGAYRSANYRRDGRGLHTLRERSYSMIVQ
jgi:hypothetical protein